jgi:dihydroorotase
MQGSVIIEGEQIAQVCTVDMEPLLENYDEVIDATGCHLLPGIIDEHVHFRDPGLTDKGDIFTESRAAAAGGVTSIMDMPNTKPPTVTLDALHEKQELLDQRCLVNHSCYFGATVDNYYLFDQLDRSKVCGIKLFMGASTGNMLVQGIAALHRIFSSTDDMLLAVHCEDPRVIQRNLTHALSKFGHPADLPVEQHASIRSVTACYDSTKLAVRLALEAGTRLHLLHLSTDKEIGLLHQRPASARITSEVCVPHLLFSYNDYATLGSRIKCNPAVKRPRHRIALRKAVADGTIDAIATDHAPHAAADKQGGALTAASGMPMIQFSLVSMLRLTDEGVFPIETLVERMCHAPARIYHIDGRGYIRKNYYADLTLVRRGTPWTLTPDKILSKCGWSPLEGQTFNWEVLRTIVNGHTVYDRGRIDTTRRGASLRFNTL